MDYRHRIGERERELGFWHGVATVLWAEAWVIGTLVICYLAYEALA
jgi:hypothetical protein